MRFPLLRYSEARRCVAYLLAALPLTACLGTARQATQTRRHPVDRPAPDSFVVRFTTTKGPFDVMVQRALTPRGADRVYGLVRARYYDGARFFRAVPTP